KGAAAAEAADDHLIAERPRRIRAVNGDAPGAAPAAKRRRTQGAITDIPAFAAYGAAIADGQFAIPAPSADVQTRRVPGGASAGNRSLALIGRQTMGSDNIGCSGPN